MWTVYTEEQHRAALREWADGEPAPEDWRTRNRRQESYDQEAQAVAACVEVELQRRDHPLPVFFYVGSGGNGCAGLRAAWLLLGRGYRVEVELLPVPLESDDPDRCPAPVEDHRERWRQEATPEARELFEGFLERGGQLTSSWFHHEVRELAVTVDAICGRGIDGRLRGPATAWACHVDIAIDSPTGMLPDSGRTVPASERAQPARGGFTAATTVVLGGLRAVHLLREDCGRLVFVPGGLSGILRRTEEDRRRESLIADGDTFDTHGYLSVRTRSGILARDPVPEKSVPGFPDSDGHGAVYHPEVLGDLDLIFDVRRRIRPASHVCIMGSPRRRPGAPLIVAAGATGTRPVQLLADEDAVRKLQYTYPETEQSDRDIRETVLPHVVCAGSDREYMTCLERVVVTPDAIREWLDEGLRPPERTEGQLSVLVVDRPTADESLDAWAGARDRDVAPHRWDPVAVAERLAACTGYAVILTGSTTIYCRGNSTFLVRTATDAVRVQGMPEVIAGAVAATRLQDDWSVESAIILLARAASAEAEDVSAVPSAERIARRQRSKLYDLQEPSRRSAGVLP